MSIQSGGLLGPLSGPNYDRALESRMKVILLRRRLSLPVIFRLLIQYGFSIATSVNNQTVDAVPTNLLRSGLRQSVIDSDGAIIVGHIVPALTDGQISTDMLQHGQTVGNAIFPIDHSIPRL